MVPTVGIPLAAAVSTKFVSSVAVMIPLLLASSFERAPTLIR